MKLHRKVIFYALLPVGCLALAGCLASADNQTQTLPLENPPPSPFAKDARTLERSTFKPKIEGNTVFYGNKGLEVLPDGTFRILAEDSVLGEITNSIFLKDFSFSRTSDKKIFTLGQLKNDGKGKFDLEGSFLMTKDGVGKGAFHQTVELLPDDRISIDTQFTAPSGYEGFVNDESLFISFPAVKSRSAEIAVGSLDQKTEVFKFPDEAKYRFFSTRNAKSVSFFPGIPEKVFQIEPVSCGEILGLSTADSNSVRFYESKHRTAFILDLREGVKTIQSQKHAGLDMKKLEDLNVPDWTSTRNLLLNPSFEQGANCAMYLWFNGFAMTEEKWNSNAFGIDKTVSKFGRASLRLNTWVKERKDGYRSITEGGNIFTFPVLLEPGDYMFSFYVKGNRKGQDISVWFPSTYMHDSNSWISLPTSKICPVTDNWIRHELTLKNPHNLPIRVAFNAISPTGDGSVWVDGMQLERGNKVTEFVPRAAESELVTSASDNFIRYGDPINAVLRVTSAESNADGKVKVTAKNFFSEIIYSGEYDLKTGSDSSAEIKLPLDGKTPRGVFVVKAEYSMADGKKAYDLSRFAVMDFMENKHRLKNIFQITYAHMAQSSDFYSILDRCRKAGYGSKGWLHENYERAAKAYEKYGLDISHGYTAQRTVINGKSGFRVYEEFPPHTNQLKNYIPLIKDFREENPNGELTDDYLRRFGEAVEQVVKAHPWTPAWSLHGEDEAANPGFAGLTATDAEFAKYIKLLIANYKAVKKANPAAKVVSPLPCNMSQSNGIATLDRVLKETDGKIKFDIIGVHIYRESPEQPDLDADTDALIAMLARHGYDKTPIIWPEGMQYGPYNIPQWGITSAQWIPPKNWESGPLSYDMGWTEKVASAWQARTWLVALKHSDRIAFVNSIAWPIIFGMDISLTPFAAQKIPNTLGKLLGDSYFKQDIRFAPYTRCFVFEDAQKRPVAAVWSHDPAIDAGIAKAPIAAAAFGKNLPEVFDLMEAERQPDLDSDGRVRFPVSSFPLFFRGRAGETDAFIKAFDSASIVSGATVPPLGISGKPFGKNELNLEIDNMLSKPFEGELTVAGEKHPVSVKPSGKTVISTAMPEPLRDDRIVRENMSVSISGPSATGKIEDDISFEGFLCRKSKSPITVDGSFEDWKGIPSIPVKNRFAGKKDVKDMSDNNFSAVFKTAWDSQNFYILVIVKDDKFVHEEYPDDKKGWENDSLQIYFDTLLDGRRKAKAGKFGYDENDYDYAIFPNAAGDSTFAFRYYTPNAQLTLGTAAPRNLTREPDIKTAFKKTADGYVYEIAIPAMWLLPISLKSGESFGMGLFLNDKDENGKGVESSLTLTPGGTGCYNNPHLWPTVLLGE